MRKRIWEIDFLRGVAILLMIAFHLIYDLREYYSYDFDYTRGFWYYEGKTAAIMFMLLSGISATFSRSSLRRGTLVFGAGMLVTLATLIYDPQYYVRFGILHLLGFSMIAYHFIRNWSKGWLFAIGIAAIALGNSFAKVTVDSPFWFPLGLVTSSFSSLDYYPILPWFGVFAVGAGLGKALYSDKKSYYKTYPNDPLSFLGRHSLFIYLVHQPLLLVLLALIHRRF